MDVIRDVSGDEAKLLALQFLGQNLGEMKELDKNIVSSLKPIAGSLDPNAMLNSIPQGSAPQPAPAPAPALAPVSVIAPTSVQAGPVVIPSLASLQGNTVVTASQVVTTVPPTDPNQLELNFNTSPYTESIFNKLESIEKKLKLIIESQENIVASIETLKKKNRASATISL